MSNKNDIRPDTFNVKEFIAKAFSYKFFYILCILLLVAGAYLYNRFAPTIYQVNSTIGPVEESRSSFLESAERFSGLAELDQSRNLENDINSLRSFSLVSETIKKLGLEIAYYRESDNLLKQTSQIYNSNYYTVNIDKSHVQSINARFYIEALTDTTYRLRIAEDNVSLYNYLDNKITSSGIQVYSDTVCKFNQTVTTPYFKFSVTRDLNTTGSNKGGGLPTFFRLHHVDNITSQYLKRLVVEPVSTRSTLINVFFQGENRELTVDFLNAYIQTYLDNDLAKKNSIALNTMNFIDAQLSEISDSLYLSESKLRDYRSTHQVTDLSYQGQQALNQMTQIENEKSTLKVQERYYNYILDYFNTNKDIAGLAPPSAANVVDPIMNTLVLELLDLNAQRSAILSNNAEKNLFLDQIENKINLQKKTIIENVKNNLNNLSLTMNELEYRERRLSNQISSLPRTELNMVSMQRQYNLTDAIYTYMLQKRSEAGIAMASNYPDYEILEPARETTMTQIAPKPTLNYMVAVFLGLLIPSLFIILKDFFNEKITRINEIEYLIERPVLGTIYNNPFKTEAVVHEAAGSAISESFRNLRSSLFLMSKKNPLKVILVTSSQPQDGKSFVAMNLASSIAAVGYETIIIDCDLRKPTLHEKFNVINSGGLSKYLAEKTDIEDIIINTFVDNLDFIPSGPVLPNSSELIESGALDELIEYLKNKYEYVIIDTTPSGLVADAALLMKYASLSLLVCRDNHTRKDVFTGVVNFYNTHSIVSYDVIYNDMEVKESRYGRYHGYYRKPKDVKKKNKIKL
ncbi:MAG TPA: polysaccharide biosynthesis tyrosine autokinase [Bacteroidetes bacterium]|nr:polysaccharide biosynthesis tyrosine autokinase [Bacteroidota bacterium]